MARPYEKPVTEKREGPGKDENCTKTTHPAFASGDTFLYGSEFRHNHYVTIEICKSEVNRDLSRDWYFSRREVIEVAMTESQWATFVSSMNMGSGIPCTIQSIDLEMVPGISHVADTRKQFDKDIRDRLRIVEQSLDDLEKAIDASRLSQKGKDELLSLLGYATQNLTPNLTFVSDQFGEHMEETFEKAKVEIEAYINAAMNRAGVEALNERATLKLQEGNDDGA
ncbi:MAG: hypothetical protein ACYSW8_33325 [Planctomycetota bacterium]|jgi:hypothetical protein